MSDVVKLALVGCGAIARFHLDGIDEHAPRIEVTAAVDTDRSKAESFAAETGAQVFTSLDDALDDGDFDAVDLMLPHDLHEAAAIQCLQADKHVLLEKPMAPTLDACERILAAAAASPRVFMVGENAQYWPEVVKTQALIQDGAIGEVTTARAAFVMEFDEYWFKEKKPWRYDRQRTGGGIAIDGGSHWLRPLRMWMGEFDAIVGAIDHPLEPMEGESLVRSLIRFRSGKVASFDCLMAPTVLGPDPWWRITGTKGEITIDGGFAGGIRLYDSDHRQGRLVQEPLGYAQSFGPELADFAAAILDGTPLAAPPEHALGELRTALALYRSVESQAWEKVWA